MPERATVFQGTRIGFETTPGTPVAPTRILKAAGLSAAPVVESDQFRPTGNKFNTVNSPNIEYMRATLDGRLTYNEIVFLLSAFINNPTAVQIASTGTYTWTYTPNSSAADTPKTLTVEQGDANRAHRWANGLFSAMNFSFGRRGITMGGEMIGEAIEDDVALSGTPTAVTPKLVLPRELSLKMATTQAGLAAASPLTRAFRADISLGNRFAPIWPIGSVDSPANVEMPNDLTGQILVEADDNGMALLAPMRDGTQRFFRIAAINENSAPGGEDYLFQIDFSAGVGNLSALGDQDGVYAATFDLVGIDDATWGKAVEIKAQNELATL